MKKQIYAILKFLALFFILLGPLSIIFFLREYGLNLFATLSLWILLAVLTSIGILRLFKYHISEFWDNYRCLVFIFLIAGIPLWFILGTIGINPILFLAIFLFTLFILPYILLKHENLRFFFGLLIFYLIFPGVLIHGLIAPSDHILDVFIFFILPISLILASVTFAIKKIYPHKLKFLDF